MPLNQSLRHPLRATTTASQGSAPCLSFRAHLPAWFLSLLLGCLMTTSLAASADDRSVFHSFGHSLDVDSPGVGLLACRYGDNLGFATAQQLDQLGFSVDDYVCSDLAGNMRPEDFLQVKWRDRATQQVYEERVDLKRRLPSPNKMRGTKVYFLIDENQLYVYLIPQQNADATLNRRPKNKPPNGPSRYAFLDVKTLYPDNDPPKVRGGARGNDIAQRELEYAETHDPKDGLDAPRQVTTDGMKLETLEANGWKRFEAVDNIVWRKDFPACGGVTTYATVLEPIPRPNTGTLRRMDATVYFVGANGRITDTRDFSQDGHDPRNAMLAVDIDMLVEQVVPNQCQSQSPAAEPPLQPVPQTREK